MNSETEEKTWTIKRLLNWTSDFFASKGLESSRLSAEILLSEAVRCNRIDLYTRFGDVPGEATLAQFRDWVKRHAAGEPVAYLVGCKEFYSLKFIVSSSVLIPRPETEHVVIAAIDAAKSTSKNRVKILDIGTGSGCIAVTLAKQLPNAQLVATDISSEAIEIARRNAAEHEVDSRIEFVTGDLFENVPAELEPDIIVSNPPYIGHDEMARVDKSVREFEPHIALFAGREGTEMIERLVRESAIQLAPKGWMIFETSPIVCDSCLRIAASESAFEEPTVVKDLAGHRRVIVLRKQA